MLAQQKELEECIIPLEKEYKDVPISDVDRDQTYKLAESIDAQLKQMSEDLKEIIEHLNESNKVQELSDPVIIFYWNSSFVIKKIYFVGSTDRTYIKCSYEFIAVY